MTKKIICLICALCMIATTCACGSSKKEEAPLINTVITPQNWAIAEDYGDYEQPTEPVEEPTLPVETAPPETQPEETEPVIEPSLESYDIARDDYGTLIPDDLSKITFNGVVYDLTELTVDTIVNEWGLTQGEPVQESGVLAMYYFDGHKYTGENIEIAVDADDDGYIQAITFSSGDFMIVNDSIKPGMDINEYYTIAGDWGIIKFIPGEDVISSHGLISGGYIGFMSVSHTALDSFTIFASEYVESWGPVA